MPDDTPTGKSKATEKAKLDIRKYPNRRYYDTTRSQHVKLEEIHDLIRQGHEVQVTDSRTGQDITAKVLAQILLELDPPKLGVFPAPLLHRLIRANEQLLQDFTEKYFNRALESFLQSQKQFEVYLRHAVGLPASVPDWARMFNPFMHPFWPGFAADDNGHPRGPEPRNASEMQQQVESLRAQLQALEARLAQEQARPRESV